MITPDAFDPAAYVAAVAPTVGLVLPPERQARVAQALALVARVAAPALHFPVPESAEPAEKFRP